MMMLSVITAREGERGRKEKYEKYDKIK